MSRINLTWPTLANLRQHELITRGIQRFTRWMDRLAGRMNAEDKAEGDYFDELDNQLARGPIRYGMWTIAVAAGGFFLWSALAPISSAAVAPGSVVLDTNKKTIQHLEGGIIEEILVHEGMYVEAGQPLIRLSETAAKARADLLAAQYYAERAAEVRLIAERDNLDRMEFPEDLVQKAGKKEDIADILDSQQRLFEARRKALEGQVEVLKQRINQLNDEISGLQAQEKASGDQIVLLDEEIAVVDKLLKQGNAMKPRLLALQRQAADLQGKRGEYIAMIARARQSITETELEIINARNDYLNKVVAELRETQVKLSTLEEQVRASADILDRIVILAPQSGIVTGLKFHTKGGVIAPGAAIMDIVPQDDKLIVETKVRPEDIDVVHKGQEARVRLTAYKVRKIPLLEGKVTTVTPDRIVNEATHESYYLARIEINESELASVKEVALYPGMPAEVLIVTGERTLFSYLIAPITDAMFRSFREQ